MARREQAGQVKVKQQGRRSGPRIVELEPRQQTVRVSIPDREKAERIREVIDRQAIKVVGQPIVDLGSWEKIGIEALVRFAAGPLRGPEWWFAAAGEVGLKTELELSATRATLRHATSIQWPMFLSINASPETVVDPEFQAEVLAGPTDRIVVEVTEHDAVPDYEPLEEAAITLRSFSVRIAVDDVGAGFASMRHVLHLAPEIIKLDLSLTKGIESDRSRRALVSSLVRFAAATGTTLVAEGIETGPQLETLRMLGIRHGQGFYLGSPEPLPPRTGWEPGGGLAG